MAEQATLLSDHIQAALDDKNLTIKDLALSLNITYEHARRLTRGLAPPSRFILKDLCALLDLNYQEMLRLSTADNIRRKYGTIPLELAGKDPSLEPVERGWPKLTDDQRALIVATVRHYVGANKAAGVVR